jgi:hypothetical protein
MRKKANNGHPKAGAINCNSVHLCKENPLFSNQFLRQVQVEVVESKRRITGSYGVAGFGNETATKVLVVPVSCTARKVLCI